MFEMTIAFKHPEGPVKGLELLDAIERKLSRHGCKFVDHGTCFKRVRGGTRFSVASRKGRNLYEGSDTTMECEKKPPHSVIRKAVYEAGVEKFSVKYTRSHPLSKVLDSAGLKRARRKLVK